MSLTANELLTLANAACRSRAVRLIYADALDEAGRSEAARFQRLLGESRRAYYRDGNWGNVYRVYVVPESQTGRFGRLFMEAWRITREQAIYNGWTRPREVRELKRQGIQTDFWAGGFYNHDRSSAAETVNEALDWACEDTLIEMDCRETRE